MQVKAPPSCSETDVNEGHPTSSENVQVEALPPGSETEEYKIGTPAQSFKKKNDSSKVNLNVPQTIKIINSYIRHPILQVWI